ncbi:zinc ABC transporter substrate-binding protein [Thalassotalea nanhaiensis]|uniref:Zinc ABC transporter substrate-binding protein n=1 Tax=Thalassotalea nanhaiensis TaxID=3065648 RepID=A0ABY9TKN8_9GAMM|nr:zinc ABC transporter substrate-binding protein [Colwelliaceae bacterium SQ345]
MRINFKQKFALVCTALLVTMLPAQAQLNIFACEPEYAALAKELAGDDANIFSATTAKQDPHFVQARPSLISKMRRADVVICAGADLEIGWLPMLQMKSNNRDVQSTEKGLFLASDHVENLDIPVKVDRSMGDVHVLGNPHVHLDPFRVASLAKSFTEKLVQLDGPNAAVYQKNLADFSQRWKTATAKWQKKAEPLQGMKVVAYHSSFKYLFEFLGMQQVGDLEPKPGLPPTSSHLLSVLDIVNQQQVKLVVYTSYQDAKAADWLQDKTDIVSLQLPYTVGGNKQSVDLFTMMEQHISMLLLSLEQK